jgi:hypothetical protein
VFKARTTEAVNNPPNLACKFLSVRTGYEIKNKSGDPVFLSGTTEAANNPWQAKQPAQGPRIRQQSI